MQRWPLNKTGFSVAVGFSVAEENSLSPLHVFVSKVNQITFCLHYQTE